MSGEVGSVWRKLNELQLIVSNDNGINVCEARSINHAHLMFFHVQFLCLNLPNINS
jgi:hypothetical protein